MPFYAYGIIDADEINNVYTFGSHQYALYFWLKCVEQGIIRKYASLIHIDFHSDFLSHRVKIDKGIDSLCIEDLIKKRMIHYDDFIKLALSLNIIQNIKFCCKPKWGEFNDVRPFKNYVSPTTLLNSIRRDNMFSVSDIILDIDLDFFIDFKSEYIQLKEEEQIKKEIAAINEIFKFSKIATVCTSHEWIWNKQQREKIQNIFSEYFAVKIDFSKKPEQIYGLVRH